MTTNQCSWDAHMMYQVVLQKISLTHNPQTWMANILVHHHDQVVAFSSLHHGQFGCAPRPLPSPIAALILGLSKPPPPIFLVKPGVTIQDGAVQPLVQHAVVTCCRTRRSPQATWHHPPLQQCEHTWFCRPPAGPCQSLPAAVSQA
jgi:hypothetical protein